MSPGDGLYMMSCVHPSGTHAVCWGGSGGRPRLWLGDGSGTFEPITDGRLSARYPAFNAEGDLLVYCRSPHLSETIEHLRAQGTVMPGPAVSMSIVVRAADGSWEREITDGRYQDQRPALSPDGSRVVFVSNRRGPYELWTVSTTAGEPVRLLRGIRAYRPWWSVDGRSIFYFTLGRSPHRLHVIPANGGEPKALPNDDRGDTHGPYADPDAMTLIGHSTRDAVRGSTTSPWAVYEFPLDGSPARRLSRGAHGTRARNGVITYDERRPR
jgi:Tol biopolymer transport system component